MSLIREAMRGVMIVAVSTLWTGAALAQEDLSGELPTPPTPRQVVEHCLGQMGEITGTTIGAIRERTGGGVEAIVQLVQNDAGPRRILFAGDVAKATCTRAAARGQHALDDTLHRCLHALHALDAPDEAFGVVREARRRAGHAIGDALTHCKRTINHAVVRALHEIGDDPDGGDEPEPVATQGAVLLTE